MVAIAPVRCPRRAPPGRPGFPAGRCLVVSGDPVLRRCVRSAAVACGWACVAAADDSARAAGGGGYGAVFVDLVRPPGSAASAARLAAAFAADRRASVVVCGAPDRPDEEVRVRQSGPCIYLPGAAVGPGLAALVRAVCRERKR